MAAEVMQEVEFEVLHVLDVHADLEAIRVPSGGGGVSSRDTVDEEVSDMNAASLFNFGWVMSAGVRDAFVVLWTMSRYAAVYRFDDPRKVDGPVKLAFFLLLSEQTQCWGGAGISHDLWTVSGDGRQLGRPLHLQVAVDKFARGAPSEGPPVEWDSKQVPVYEAFVDGPEPAVDLSSMQRVSLTNCERVALVSSSGPVARFLDLRRGVLVAELRPWFATNLWSTNTNVDDTLVSLSLLSGHVGVYHVCIEEDEAGQVTHVKLMPLHVLRACSSCAWQARWHPVDPFIVAVSGMDGRASVHHVLTGERLELYRLPFIGQCKTLCWAPSGRHILVAGEGSFDIGVCDVNDGVVRGMHRTALLRERFAAARAQVIDEPESSAEAKIETMTSIDQEVRESPAMPVPARVVRDALSETQLVHAKQRSCDMVYRSNICGTVWNLVPSPCQRFLVCCSHDRKATLLKWPSSLNKTAGCVALLQGLQSPDSALCQHFLSSTMCELQTLRLIFEFL